MSSIDAPTQQERRLRRLDAFIREGFFQSYFSSGVLNHTFWMGTKVLKCPLDLWVYQEIILSQKPDLIIETGTAYGGSAHFLAAICGLAGNGRVISIDIDEMKRPEHPRLQYWTGSSISGEIGKRLQQERRSSPKDSVMVILDSNHSTDHVLAELDIYSEFVTQGQYLIVEDTCIWGGGNGGPRHAVEMFLLQDDRFDVDQGREKFQMTFNPYGYLRKVKA